MIDFAKARRNMVDCQLRTNKVTDRALLAAFEETPRERFVDQAYQSIAYADEKVPMGNGRFLAPPMVLARLLQDIAVGPDDVVLDIGCGTGYSVALLSRLAATVVGLECDAELARQANELITGLACDTAIVIEGPLAEGYAAQGPYDIILIGGEIGLVPDAILDQLSEGGRLAAILNEGDGQCRGVLMTRRGGVASRRIVCDATAPPMPGFKHQAGFVF
ncbi:MAG: protein-L-isoaspartate O-methyltransferase [Alphaproteobacteria bacterium]